VPVTDRETSATVLFSGEKGASMLRKWLCAIVVTAIAAAAVKAEEITLQIYKVGDGTLNAATVEGKGKDAKISDTKTDYKISKDVKVNKVVGFDKDTMKFKTETIADGLKDKIFTDIGEKGIRARVNVGDDKTITEINVFAFGKKKNAPVAG